MIGMTRRSASAKLWYVSPSLTVRRSSMAWTFWSPEWCNGESDGVYRSSDQQQRVALPWRSAGWRCWNVSTALGWSSAAERRTRSCSRRPRASWRRTGAWPGHFLSKGSVIVQQNEHQTQISDRTTGQDASYPLHVWLGGIDVVIQAFEGDLGLLCLFTLPLKLLFTLESKQSEAERWKVVFPLTHALFLFGILEQQIKTVHQIDPYKRCENVSNITAFVCKSDSTGLMFRFDCCYTEEKLESLSLAPNTSGADCISLPASPSGSH